MSLDVHLGQLEFIPGLFWYRDMSGTGGTAATEEDGTTPPPAEHVHDETGGHVHATSANGAKIFSGTVGFIYSFRPDLLGTVRYDFHD
jgi:hypothetical protein